MFKASKSKGLAQMKKGGLKVMQKAFLKTLQAGMKQLLDRKVQYQIASLSKKGKRKGVKGQDEREDKSW